MKVRYSPVIGGALLALGVLCLFLGLWLLALGEFSPAIFPGILVTLIGILYFARPYFWLYQGSVVVPALLGPAKKEIPFERIEIDGKRLVTIRKDGTRKKVPVYRWTAHPADWKAVLATVSGAEH